MSGGDIGLSDLREGVRAVLESAASAARVRAHYDSGARRDEALWRTASELGWMGLSVAEAHGGLGLDASALHVLYEEIGRKVAPLPLLGSMLTAQTIALLGSDELKAQWLPPLASGEVQASVAADACTPSWDGVRLEACGDQVALNGIAGGFLDGAAADVFLIAARAGGGEPVFVLAPRDAVSEIKVVALVDHTRSLASVRVDAAVLSAECVLKGDALAAADAMAAHAAIALACESVAGARAILDVTVDYLKTREQFGKPIGSFQTLKHRCADHKVAIEAAGALVTRAIEEWRDRAASQLLTAALAKSLACDMFAAVAEDAVQLHGGIGFTWEHACHLYLKRAKLNQCLFGTSAANKDRAAALLAAA